MKRVFLFSPSRHSLYTTTVAELLRQRGIAISTIVVMRLLNRKRLVSEFRRDGTRLLRKVWSKLLLRERGYARDDTETIVSFRKGLNIRYRDVDQFGRRWNVPVVYCNTLNDSEVVEHLEKTQPDLVVFTGGGLIRKQVLDRSGHGVVNCHMGILPEYRGMDVVEWPILAGAMDRIGVTVHFMDQGVDTGDILMVKKIEPRKDETVNQLRKRFEPLMCESIVDACVGFLEGRVERHTQRIEDGKQYFVMHRSLIKLVDRKLARAVSGDR
jgi:folate-dependent phosphoribosylglycinamide formyltransferase PurN